MLWRRGMGQVDEQNTKKQTTLADRLSWSIAAIVLLACLIGVAHKVWITNSRTVAFREDNLQIELDGIVATLNSEARERLSVATALARKGEFLALLARAELTEIKSEAGEKLIGTEIARMIESFPSVVGGGIFFEPNAFNPDAKQKGFYARWVPPVGMSRKVEYSLAKSAPGVDFHNSEWYRALIPAGWDPKRHLYVDSGWTGPYRDRVTLVPMITALNAMYSRESELIGLASVDWNLDELTAMIDSSRPTENSVAMLFSPGAKKFAAVAGLQGLNLEPISKARWMPYLLLNAPQDRYEMVRAVDEDGLPFRAYSRALENGLIYSVLIPEAEILGVAYRSGYLELGFFVALLIFVLVTIVVLVKNRLRPLSELVDCAARFSAGDYRRKPKVQRRDELGQLSKALGEQQLYLQGIGQQAELLSRGELGIDLNVRSKLDTASTAVNNITLVLSSFSDSLSSVEDTMKNGDFGARLDTTKFSGVWQSFATSINRIIDTLESPLQELGDLASSSRTSYVLPQLHSKRAGELEELRSNLNDLLREHDEQLRDRGARIRSLEQSFTESQFISKSKSEILANVCDDFNEMLREIQHGLATLSQHAANESQRVLLQSCQESIEVMSALSEDMLSYVSIEQRNEEQSYETVRLQTLLFDIKDILRPQAVRRGQEFRFNIEAEVPNEIRIDAQRLRLALLNLLSHSIRHTELGGSVTTTFSLGQETAHTQSLHIKLSDTGKSPLRKRRSIMLNAYRDGIKENVAETGGLGLLYAEQIISQLGGSLEVEHQTDIGANFSITLPVLRMDDEETMDEGEEFTDEAQAVFAHLPAVLIVEPHRVSASLLRDLFQERGFRVTVVSEIEEALRELDESSYVLSLVDIDVSESEAFELVERLRESPSLPSDAAIVGMSNNNRIVEQGVCSLNGINGYLRKPATMESISRLLDSLQSLFEKTRYEEESTNAPTSVQ